jgi:hypothetical protein
MKFGCLNVLLLFLSSTIRMHWRPLVHVQRIARHRVQHFAALIAIAIMFSFAIRVVI